MPGELRSVRFACGLMTAVVVMAGSARAEEGLHAGLFYDEFNLTLAPGQRTEAAGPLWYEEDKETLHTWAVPPLVSYARDPETELKEFDVLYPALTYDRYGQQYRWQLFQLLSFSGGPSQESTQHRSTLFPFYFHQSSTDPSRNYTAVVPFYGHMQRHLFKDEIFFVMFPCYAQSRKKDVVTDNYLYPFFHLRHGNGLEGWQFWPLCGHEHKEITRVTNGFGDVSVVPGHDKVFALWPLFFNDHTGIGTTNPAWEQSSIPAYSFLRSPMRDSTTVIWPFFNHIVDREKKYEEWDAPWPLIVFAHGEGKTTHRVWPFFSHAYNTNHETGFYAWPIWKWEHATSDSLDHDRKRVLFFLYSDTKDKNTELGKTRRRVDFWPLYQYRQDYSGNRRLQVLALIETFAVGSHKIQRDWSPLWSVWRSESNPKTGCSSQSLLWNLYRRDVVPAQHRTSALFGLFQRETTPHGNGLRLFFVPITRPEPVFEPVAR
jgi:hypothetical protein